MVDEEAGGGPDEGMEDADDDDTDNVEIDDAMAGEEQPVAAEQPEQPTQTPAAAQPSAPAVLAQAEAPAPVQQAPDVGTAQPAVQARQESEPTPEQPVAAADAHVTAEGEADVADGDDGGEEFVHEFLGSDGDESEEIDLEGDVIGGDFDLLQPDPTAPAPRQQEDQQQQPVPQQAPVVAAAEVQHPEVEAAGGAAGGLQTAAAQAQAAQFLSGLGGAEEVAAPPPTPAAPAAAPAAAEGAATEGGDAQRQAAETPVAAEAEAPRSPPSEAPGRARPAPEPAQPSAGEQPGQQQEEGGRRRKRQPIVFRPEGAAAAPAPKRIQTTPVADAGGGGGAAPAQRKATPVPGRGAAQAIQTITVCVPSSRERCSVSSHCICIVPRTSLSHCRKGLLTTLDVNKLPDQTCSGLTASGLLLHVSSHRARQRRPGLAAAPRALRTEPRAVVAVLVRYSPLPCRVSCALDMQLMRDAEKACCRRCGFVMQVLNRSQGSGR